MAMKKGKVYAADRKPGKGPYTVQTDDFSKSKDEFEAAIKHAQYRGWLNDALVSAAFYDGNQLSATERNELMEMGQVPVIVNLIKTRIDNITGQEIKTRTKFRYRSRSGKANEVKTANALSDLSYYQSDNERSMAKLSDVGLNARVIGIGWHEFEVEEEPRRLCERVGDPFEFVWDVADKTKDMSNQRHVFRYRWLELADAEEMFPKFKDYLRGLAERNTRGIQEEFAKGLLEVNTEYGSPAGQIFSGVYNDAEKGMVCVVEKQYRVRADLWEAITKDGKVVRTFDKDEAERVAKNKKIGDGIFRNRGWKVKSIFFTADTELWHGDLEQQIDPINGAFLYTPYVYNRELISGKPYGAVRGAIDPQRMYNKKASKLLWLLSSRQIVAEADASDDWEDVAEQAAKPDGIILLKEGALNKIKLDRNQPEIATHFQSMQQHLIEIKEALGIYDESMGAQTNAQSGLAIGRRQQGTQNNFVLPQDRFREMKIRHGKKLLQLLRTTYTEQVVFWITDDQGASKEMSLNEPVLDPETMEPKKDKKGNVILINDVRVGDYDLYLEEIPDYTTQREESFQKLLEVAKSGLPITAGWAELAGIPNGATIVQELNSGNTSGSNGSPEGGPQQNSPAGAPGQGQPPAKGAPPKPGAPAGGAVRTA